MVARVDGIDGDDRQLAQILAPVGGERKFRCRPGLGERFAVEDVRNLMPRDRDHAQRLRREGIADTVDDLRLGRRPAPRQFGAHQIADFGIALVGDREVEARALVGGTQPDHRLAAGRLVLDEHPDHHLCARLQPLHRMRDMAAAAFLGAREDAVADAERAPRTFRASLLHHAQPRRGTGAFPAFGHRPDIAALDRRDAQHGYARQAAMFVKGAARRQIDEPLVGHIPEQRLQRDLVIAVEREMLRDLAFADGLVGRRNEVEDLLTGRQAGGYIRTFFHWSKAISAPGAFTKR